MNNTKDSTGTSIVETGVVDDMYVAEYGNTSNDHECRHDKRAKRSKSPSKGIHSGEPINKEKRDAIRDQGDLSSDNNVYANHENDDVTDDDARVHNMTYDDPDNYDDHVYESMHVSHRRDKKRSDYDHMQQIYDSPGSNVTAKRVRKNARSRQRIQDVNYTASDEENVYGNTDFEATRTQRDSDEDSVYENIDFGATRTQETSGAVYENKVVKNGAPTKPLRKHARKISASQTTPQTYTNVKTYTSSHNTGVVRSFNTDDAGNTYEDVENIYEPIEASEMRSHVKSVRQPYVKDEEKLAQLHRASPVLRNAYARQVYRIVPQELKLHDKRVDNADVVFKYSAQKDIKRMMLAGSLKRSDVKRNFKKGDCVDMDVKELHDLLAPRIGNVIRYRDIDITKPIKVVFMTYENVLQKSSATRHKYENITRFGQSLLDSVHDMALQPNTIYVLMSGRAEAWPKQKKKFDNLGLFDLCVTMEETSVVDTALKHKRIFGRLKSATSQLDGTYTNEVEGEKYFFKQNVLKQVLDILQKDLHVAHMDVVVIDHNSISRQLAQMECELRGVDSCLLVNPEDITAKHVACMIGNCDSEEHKPLVDVVEPQDSDLSDNDDSNATKTLMKCRYFDVEWRHKCKRAEMNDVGIPSEDIPCVEGCTKKHNDEISAMYHKQSETTNLFDFFKHILKVQN